jgi:thiol-disulfide isomerase/thioredoxin
MTVRLMNLSVALAVAWLPATRGADPTPPKKPTLTPAETAALAAALDKAYDGARQPEAAKMLTAILRGSQMGPGEGWFGPAQTRYTWEWLAKLHGIDPKKDSISKSTFRGSADLFARLDRNKDGRITAEDLDWSDDSAYVQMSDTIHQIFRRLDRKGAGKLSKEDWQAVFDRAAGGKDAMTGDDFRDMLLTGFSASFMQGDAPDPAVLIRGLFAGEIGSFNEGPRVGQPAPNFALKRVDGKGTIELGKLTGEKPVVLVFGNFTCGPFRSTYPAVDEVYQRYKDRANFLMVYVREAHPADGWKMMSNSRAGVDVKQPTTFDERVGVANQFCTKLKPNLPVVVDEISDPAGHAYSGMPARLYVIDPAGTVAYKSGRGPFGFKVPELEQALVMCLLEQSRKEKPTAGK